MCRIDNAHHLVIVAVDLAELLQQFWGVGSSLTLLVFWHTSQSLSYCLYKCLCDCLNVCAKFYSHQLVFCHVLL